MKLYDEGFKLTKEEIDNYEKEFNINFPKEYIQFLLESNGGTPEDDVAFDFIDAASNKENSTSIREFFIFYKNNESSYDDIVKVNRIMCSENLISSDYWVFADDSAGNPICMKIKGENIGSIYFCDHELEDANTGHLLMSYISNSFNCFLEKLYIIEY